MQSQNPYNLAPGKSRGGEPMLLRNKDSVSIKISGSDTEGRIAIFEGFVSPWRGSDSSPASPPERMVVRA